MALFGDDIATGPALRALGRARRVRGHFPHVAGLHRTAELSSQFVGAGFDDGIVGHTDDRTVDAIQGHRDSGSFLQELVQFFLKRSCRSIHESASARG